jgi:hypothetical protein
VGIAVVSETVAVQACHPIVLDAAKNEGDAWVDGAFARPERALEGRGQVA